MRLAMVWESVDECVVWRYITASSPSACSAPISRGSLGWFFHLLDGARPIGGQTSSPPPHVFRARALTPPHPAGYLAKHDRFAPRRRRPRRPGRARASGAARGAAVGQALRLAERRATGGRGAGR